MAGGSHTYYALQYSSIVDAARAVLQADGEQWTEMRARVFEILVEIG